MNKFIHILIAVILTILSVVMVFLTFQQNSTYHQETAHMLSNSTHRTAVSRNSVNDNITIKPYKPVAKGKSYTNQRVSFDYTVVSVERNQLRSGSEYTGVSAYSKNYSRQAPTVASTGNALPSYGYSSVTSTGVDNKAESFRYGNSFRIYPYSRQNQGLIAGNTENSYGSQNTSPVFNSGILASGSARQSVGAATQEDPLGVDPGGDPGDPGEMIPVPDGLGVLLLGAFLYLIAKFFRAKI